MNKILFVGDTHFYHKSPPSRVDDFYDVSLNKLNQIVNIANKNNVCAVIFTGDFFHYRDIPYPFYFNIISELKNIKSSIYSIIGNHDIPYKKIDFINKTPLGCLFLNNTIKKLDKIEIGGWKIVGGHAYIDLPKSNKKNSILVGHYFYEYSFTEELNLKKQDLMNLNYSLYILGHDHTINSMKQIGDKFLFRIGSVLRGTSHQYNWKRNVEILLLDLFDNGKFDYEFQKLEIKNGNDVFRKKIINNDFKTQMDIFLNSFVSNSIQNDFSGLINNIYLYLKKSKLDKDLKDFVKNKLEEKGLYEPTTKD